MLYSRCFAKGLVLACFSIAKDSAGRLIAIAQLLHFNRLSENTLEKPVDQVTLWVSLGILSLSLWIFLFRVIRRHSEKGESARREAVKALFLVLLSLAVQTTGRYLDRESSLEDALVIWGFLGICLGVGMFVNIKFVGPKAMTPNQFRADLVSTILVWTPLWLGVPYMGLVFAPSIGMDLGHAAAVSAVVCVGLLIWDLING